MTLPVNNTFIIIIEIKFECSVKESSIIKERDYQARNKKQKTFSQNLTVSLENLLLLIFLL